MSNLFLCIWLALTAITGVIGVCSLSLYKYIKEVEDGIKCECCSENTRCFAKKKIFKDSDCLSEFMLLSFVRVRSYCKQTQRASIVLIVIYILCNAVLIGILFWSRGCNLISIAFGISAAMLLALSVVDWNTQYIPVEYTGIIFLCGLIHLFADFSNWLQYLIGLFAVSGFLFIVNRLAVPVLSKRYSDGEEMDSVIGDGDIKLMAATGLLLGWKLNFIALGIGCITGSVIHLIRMKIKGSSAQLALGPYLSLGVYITMICGEQLVGWYLNMMGVKPL